MAKLGRADSLGEVIRASIAEYLVDVHTAVPARVTSYDATKQTISCTVALRKTRELPDGSEVTEPVAELHDVPIQFLGLGDVGITFPVPVGAPVLLLFAERSVDRWKAGDGSEVDPADVRTFHLSDAFAIPGFRPRGAKLANVPTDALTIHGDIKLGAHDATSFAARADQVDSALNTLKLAINGIAPGAVTSLPGTACTKVKVK